MKKVVVIIISIVVLFVGALAVLPVFFKQNLIELSKNTLNKQLKAEVDFTDVKLSLFKNFPKLTLELKDIVVKGKGEFEHDTLLSVGYIKTKMDMVSLFRKSGISVEEIRVQNPKLNLLVSESGKGNWELTHSSEGEETTNDDNTGEKEFQLDLEKIDIQNADLSWSDIPAQMQVVLSDLNFGISGKLYGNSTQLEVDGSVQEFSVLQNKIHYVSKSSLSLKSWVHANFDQMKFTIAENELSLNRLAMELSGSVEIPSDTTFVAIQVRSKESDFENFLALVPPAYEEYMTGIEAKGNATVAGSVTGYYFNNSYPALDFKIEVSEGDFSYNDLPGRIENIKADVHLVKAQGDMDLTQILVHEAHAEIQNNPMDFQLKISTPVSDPYFDGSMVGKINFEHLKETLPIDSVDIAGLIEANCFAKGKYSDVENESYDKITLSGMAVLSDFVYESPDFTQPIMIPSGKLDFSPQSINLSGIDVRVGQSDFRLSGKVSDYLNYIFKDACLKGKVQLNSNRVNLNELMRLQANTAVLPSTDKTKQKNKGADQEELAEVLAFDVPENIDVTFQSRIDKALLNQMPISSINGLIHAVNQELVLKNLNMNMLDGELKMNGSYKNTPENQPFFDIGFKISEFDIPVMSQTLTGVRGFMPRSGRSQGKLSSDFGMSGRLSPQMKLIPASANGKGVLNTRDLKIKDSPVFNQLGGIIKKEKLKNVSIDDFTAQFQVENGNMDLKPFTTKVIGQEAVVKGSLSATSLLNVRMDFNVEREAFGPDIQKILAIIPGNEKITMLPAGVEVVGPVGDPEVKVDLSSTQKAVTDATKDDLKKSLDNLGKGLRKLFR